MHNAIFGIYITRTYHHKTIRQ